MRIFQLVVRENENMWEDYGWWRSGCKILICQNWESPSRTWGAPARRNTTLYKEEYAVYQCSSGILYCTALYCTVLYPNAKYFQIATTVVLFYWFFFFPFAWQFTRMHEHKATENKKNFVTIEILDWYRFIYFIGRYGVSLKLFWYGRPMVAECKTIGWEKIICVEKKKTESIDIATAWKWE